MATKKVYLGKANPTRVKFFRSGLPFDFSGVTRTLINFRTSDVVVDTQVDIGIVDLSIGNGDVDFYFGGLAFLPGTYSAKIELYDANGDSEILIDYEDDLQFNFIQEFEFELDVQDSAGSKNNANSYITLEYFKSYHQQRGGDFSQWDDFEIKQAMVRAFDYVNTRFQYKSSEINPDQNSAWPRKGYLTIPCAILEASAEYALRALQSDLNPDPLATLPGKRVKAYSEAIGPISESYTFDENVDFEMPIYPAADRKIIMANLTVSTSTTFMMRG